MNLPAGEPITVTSRTQTGSDEYGDPIYMVTTVTVTGVLAPAIGAETTSGQDQVITQPTAFLPAGTVVDSLSKLTIRGVDYEVDGTPEDWRSPFTGWQPGIVVPLKRVTG